MNPAAPKFQPALYGGLFIGVLSALPIINIGNCCCLWVTAGGSSRLTCCSRTTRTDRDRGRRPGGSPRRPDRRRLGTLLSIRLK